MILVNTGVLYAAQSPKAIEYAECCAVIESSTQPLVTTDYIFDELLTLLSARGRRDAAVEAGELILDGSLVSLVRVTEADFQVAWSVFTRFSDKKWSFTDCTSYAVMQRLGITHSLSLDSHFQQFGFVSVEP